MTRIRLPHAFEPRQYQLPFLRAMEGDCNRAVCVWHRRAGKDKTFLNFMIPRMLERVGAYYYYFPTSTMGRDVLWDGMDRDGFRFMDHFPAELIKKRNEQEMKLELANGSIFKIRGTDKNEPIGVNPVGCVFSEYSRQNPRGGWDLVRPILAENGGWSVFNYTPRGKNHAYRLYEMARNNPAWYCQLLTVDDTHAIPMEAIEADRLSGMSEEMIRQEYYCSFAAGVEGSYYGRAMEQLRNDGRIGNVPHDPAAKVYTFWDLGIGDSTAIWFAQFIRREIRLIDYYENSGESIAHYAQYLQQKPYVYAEHWGPHDLRHRSIQTGTTMLDTAARLGVAFRIVDMHAIADGIEAVRGVLPQCWLDQTRCQPGIDALENYHSEYNQRRETLNNTPCHDWASHPSDGMRYLAMAYRYQIVHAGEVIGYPDPLKIAVDAESDYDYDPFAGMARRIG